MLKVDTEIRDLDWQGSGSVDFRRLNGTVESVDTAATSQALFQSPPLFQQVKPNELHFETRSMVLTFRTWEYVKDLT